MAKAHTLLIYLQVRQQSNNNITEAKIIEKHTDRD